MYEFCVTKQNRTNDLVILKMRLGMSNNKRQDLNEVSCSIAAVSDKLPGIDCSMLNFGPFDGNY